jgi:pilus assembly protein CpaB
MYGIGRPKELGKSMKGKSLALLILALGCGLVASVGITQVLKRGDTGPPPDTSPVFVAKTDIPMGSLISQDSLKIDQWPKDRVPAGAITRQEDFDGRRARQKIYADEVIIDRKLLAHGQVPTDSLVPKGLRVVPVAVTIETINGGLVLPGSRCDVQVFMRTDPSLGIPEPLCKTILQDIKVFAVNDVTSTESLDPKGPDTRSIPTGRTVSLLVTPAQAQMVTLASQLGSIRLILRSSEDNDQPKSEPVGGHEITGMASGGNRALEDPLKANEEKFMKWADEVKKNLKETAHADPTITDDHEKYTMRVRAGADVNDVLMVNNSGVQNMAGDEGVWTVTGLGPRIRTRPSETVAPKPADAAATPSPATAGAAQPPKTNSDVLLPPTAPGSPRSPGG